MTSVSERVDPAPGDQPLGRQPRRAAFGFIFVASLVNSIAFGIMIPILPNLIKQMNGGNFAAASTWNALFATVWGLMQFFIGPILGMLSDRYGRRPVLLVSIFGLFVDFMFMALAPTLQWLFVGRILNGMTAATFSTCNAYVADITAPEQRARNFGMLGSAFGFGFIIGPTIGGLLGEHDLRAPFWAAAALAGANWLYGFFVLPESLPKERRTPRINWARANPIGALAFLRSYSRLLGMAGVNLLFQLAFTVLPSIFVLYTTYRYGWTPKILGLTFLLTGVCQVGVQALLVGPVVKRIGERGAVLLGSFLGAVAFLIYALAPNGWIYLLATPIWALTGFISPALLGLMSKRVDPSHQGQMQGAVQSLQGIASFTGPAIYGLSFAWAVRNDHSSHLPGLPILIAAALMTAAFLLALRAARGPASAPEPQTV